LDVVASQLQEGLPSPPGYVLRRVLLVNYWHFDYLDLVVPHGRLFLLGENGSGKSTILGATLPLLLDGVIRPERLDTFGSTHRHIDHYVLGQPATGAHYQRRTSVAALEFARPGVPPADGAGTPPPLALDGAPLPTYLTIGVCFAGNVDSPDPVRPYRFILTDGKRLGFDLPLLDRQKRVYDSLYLRSILREHGVVAERQSEYRDLVARYLFGFADAGALDHLVEVLLLLRRPGLSNELRTFGEVYEYLKRALPKLPDEVTRTTTEAFGRIDDLRLQERRLTRQAEACSRVHQADLALARARLRQRAFPVVSVGEETQRRAAVRRARQANLERTARAHSDAEHAEAVVRQELAAARRSRDDLEASARGAEASELNRWLQAAEAERDLRRQLLNERSGVVAALQRDLDQIERRLMSRRREWQDQHRIVGAALDQLRERAGLASWPATEELVAELAVQFGALRLAEPRPRSALDHLQAALDQPLRERIVDRSQRLESLEMLVAEVERLVAATEGARQRLDLRGREAATARRHAAAAEAALQERWTGLADLVARIRPLADEAGLGDTVVGLAAAVAGREREDVVGAVERVERAARAQSERTDESVSQLNRQLGEQRKRLQEITDDLARLEADADLEPLRSPHRAAARRALAELGLPARPLYALLDFAPGLTDESRGQVERFLLDAGFLDALVLPRSSREAEALLRERGFADCWIEVGLGEGDAATPPATSPETPGFGALIADPAIDDPVWREAGQRALLSVLGRVGRNDTVAGITGDGVWWHGLLRGTGGTGATPGFIGLANRRQRRQTAIEQHRGERQLLLDAIATAEAALACLRGERARREETVQAVRSLADDRALTEAAARFAERRRQVEGAERALGEATSELAGAEERQARQQASVAEHAPSLVGEVAPDRSRVRIVLRALEAMEGPRQAALTRLERLRSIEIEQSDDLGEQATRNEQLRQATAQRDEAVRLLGQAERQVGDLRARLTSDELRAFQIRLDQAHQKVGELEGAQLQKVQQLGSLGAEVESLRVAVLDASASLAEAEGELAAAIAGLTGLLEENPDLLDDDADPSDLPAVAQRWCASGTPLAALNHEAEQAREERRAAFDEERANLVDYNLAIVAPRDRVVAQRSAQVEESLADIVRAIQTQIADTQLLLNAEEERLFKDYLCDAGLNAIHRAVQQAEGLVYQINAILRRTLLGGERYELQLEHAERSPDATPLARHHALFRKDPLAITEDERRVLFEAVRSAVSQAHRRSTEEGRAFADLLGEAFDYREWYTLHLLVTDATGHRQRISSRTARTRSGAQQLFALYVPLFAALAALYQSAEPWAPRLFVMDEAFDKVSEDNIAILLRFLVDLDFQWVVASPRLSGAGRADLPACADWQLVHNPTEQLAQAIPFLYWQGEATE
jgi:hypothetical protein